MLDMYTITIRFIVDVIGFDGMFWAVYELVLLVALLPVA